MSLLIHSSSSLSCRQPPRRDNNSPCEPHLFPPLLNISLWVTMTFQLRPFTRCLPYCQPLDPPHYGQQIAVLTDSHFDGADACRLLSVLGFFLHINTPASAVCIGLRLPWVCGPMRARLLHFTCAEMKLTGICVAVETFWTFISLRVSLLIPAVVIHLS